MNKCTAKKHLPIIQALADGKIIQYKNISDIWTNVVSPCFSDTSEYRIKPEPVERWIALLDDGFVSTEAYLTKATCERHCKHHSDFVKAIKLVEETVGEEHE